MASTDLMNAESEWRQQFAAMQAALANLKLPQKDTKADADLDDDDFGGYSSTTSGHDVWDFISDEDEYDYYSSDFADEGPGAAAVGFGAEWLFGKCAPIAAKNGMAPDVFQTQIVSVLSSGQPEDELQEQLTDLIGFDDLDFIIELLSHKDEVAASGSAHYEEPDTKGRRLLTKAQREEALRTRDFQHKTAALAPSFSKEPQYPHVYRAYNAGNSLSASGKKYGLPVGSERHQFEKYEEYSVPAGKKGVPGPGERLIKISELDGLCRNTFKGYKTLNRMQSLVFPVAYKTSENMLICAPTGAVSSIRLTINRPYQCSSL
jgi:antiviral helicase SLH1